MLTTYMASANTAYEKESWICYEERKELPLSPDALLVWNPHASTFQDVCVDLARLAQRREVRVERVQVGDVLLTTGDAEHAHASAEALHSTLQVIKRGWRAPRPPCRWLLLRLRLRLRWMLRLELGVRERVLLRLLVVVVMVMSSALRLRRVLLWLGLAVVGVVMSTLRLRRVLLSCLLVMGVVVARRRWNARCRLRWAWSRGRAKDLPRRGPTPLLLFSHPIFVFVVVLIDIPRARPTHRRHRGASQSKDLRPAKRLLRCQSSLRVVMVGGGEEVGGGRGGEGRGDVAGHRG